MKKINGRALVVSNLEGEMALFRKVPSTRKVASAKTSWTLVETKDTERLFKGKFPSSLLVSCAVMQHYKRKLSHK